MRVSAISLTWDNALINKPHVINFFLLSVLRQLNIAMMHFLLAKWNHKFGNQTIEMHCFASENQTYTGTWLFGIESWKSLKGQEHLLLKNLLVKTRTENIRFLSWRIFLQESTVFKAPMKWLLKGLYLYASFWFPAIRFDVPTLLSFSGYTHAHAKCPPVVTVRKLTAHVCKLTMTMPYMAWK